jgi:hypothetical protein
LVGFFGGWVVVSTSTAGEASRERSPCLPRFSGVGGSFVVRSEAGGCVGGRLGGGFDSSREASRFFSSWSSCFSPFVFAGSRRPPSLPRLPTSMPPFVLPRSDILIREGLCLRRGDACTTSSCFEVKQAFTLSVSKLQPNRIAWTTKKFILSYLIGQKQI